MPDGRTFQYAIVTPEAILAEGKADFLALPGHDGEFGILRSRAPLLCKLAPGIVRVSEGQQQQSFFVAGGFAHVLRNQVTILASRAKPASEVDASEVQAAEERAAAIRITDDTSFARRAEALAEARALRKLASAE